MRIDRIHSHGLAWVLGAIVSCMTAQASEQIQQFANLPPATWQNGNLNGVNSLYVEGECIPYRYEINAIPPGGSVQFEIHYDFTKGGQHAIDFQTTYDLTESAVLNSNGGLFGGTPLTTITTNQVNKNALAVPDDPTITTDDLLRSIMGTQYITIAGFYTNAFVSTPISFGASSNTNADSDKYFTITIQGITNGQIAIAWAGHLSVGSLAQWGLGNGSGSIAGSPFHENGGGTIVGGSSLSTANRSVSAGTVTPSSDLALTKSVNNSAPYVGSNIVYTVVVTNKGPSDATGVAAKDLLPSGLQYVSDTAGGAYAPLSGIWTIGTLAANAGASISITAKVLSLGAITNYAQVSSSAVSDPNSTPNNNFSGSPVTVRLPLEDDEAVVVVNSLPVADLSLVKTANNLTPGLNSNVTFFIVVTNSGPTLATNVTVMDILPAGLTFSNSVGGAYNAISGIWTIGTLNSGSVTTLQITARVNQTGPITNTAQVWVSPVRDPDSIPGNSVPSEDDQGSIVLQVPETADLSLFKTVSPAATNVGGTITYSVTVTNSGPSLAEGVSVRDLLPSGVNFVSASGGSYTLSNGIWSIGSLPVNTSTTLTILATASSSGLITNIAQVWTAAHFDPDSTPGNSVSSEDDQGQVVTTVAPAADLALTKTVDNQTPDYGSNVMFTVTVTNSGPDGASGVTVRDILPSGLSFISSSGGSYTNSNGIWSIGTLNAGSATTLQIRASVTNAGVVIQNTAQVWASDQFDPDSTPGNSVQTEDDQATVTLTVGNASDLALNKSVNNLTPNVGSQVTYTITVTNQGPNTDPGVTVRDILPTGVSYVSSSGSGYDPNTGNWAIGILPVGVSTTLTITVTVDSAGIAITNIAQVWTAQHPDPDSTPGNSVSGEDDQGQAIVTVAPAADLILTKTVDNAAPEFTSNVTFTITVTNSGPDNATGVTVQDALPAGLVYSNHVGGAYSTNTGIWSIGALSVGSSTTLQIAATIGVGGATLVNTAQVWTADQFDPNSTPANSNPAENDQASVRISVPEAADLQLTKVLSVSATNLGSTVTYTITVTNAGPNVAEGVSVKDILPAGVSFAGSSGGSYNSGTGLWGIGTIPMGSSTSLTITVVVTNTGIITNIAQVWTAAHFDPDSTPGNSVPTEDDQDKAVLTVAPAADLVLLKLVDNPSPLFGSNVTFMIGVSNSGPDTATGVTVLDLLPYGLGYSNHTGGAYVPASGIWTIGSLNAGSATTIQIVATVTNTGAIMTNTAQVQTSDQFDPNSTPGNSDPTENDQDSAQVNVGLAADLALTKTIDNASPVYLSNVTFTITVTNQGPDGATNVTVMDVMPVGLVYSNHAGGVYSTNSGIWTIGDLPSGSSTTLQIVATVTNSGVSITNSAQVWASGVFDPNSTPGNNDPTENDQASVTVNVGGAANLSLLKTVNNATPDYNANVTFTVTVTNSGPESATGVAVNDLLPAGLSYVGSSGGAYTNSSGTWNIGALAVNSSTSLTITAKVVATGPIDNTAQVQTSDQFDPNSTPGNSNPVEDDQSSVQLFVAPAADVSLTKAVNTGVTNMGGTVTYTIVVTNSGPESAEITVKDVLPSGLAFLSASSGSYNATNGIWDAGSLAAGGSALLQITATVTNTGSFTNIAQVWTQDHFDPDSTPGNSIPAEDDQAQAVLTVAPSADLALTKSASNLTPDYSTSVTFTLVLTNFGPDAATNVTVKDLLPANLAYSGSVGGTYDYTNGIWTIGTLNAGSSTTLQITATVTDGGVVIQNTAQVWTSDQFDPDSTPGNNVPAEDDQGSVTLTIPEAADLSLTKTVSNSSPNMGEQVTYTITVTNSGPNVAHGVTVQDILPAGVAYVSSSGSSYDPNTGLWGIGQLNLNTSTSLTVTVSITTGGVAITNIAQVWEALHFDPDSTPGNSAPGEDDQGQVVTTIPPAANLSLTKAASTLSPNYLGNVTFTITVTNSGPDAATGVTVKDMIPAGLSYVSSSGGLYDSTNGIWTNIALAVNASTSLTITAQVTAVGPVENMAQVQTSDQFDPNSTPGNSNPSEDDQATVSLDVPPAGDVELTKSVDNSTPNVGSTVTYTISLTNRGPDTVEITVQDILPVGVSFLGSSNGTYTATNGIWNVGTLTAGQSARLFISAVVTNSGMITNIAQVWTQDHFDPDSTPGNSVPGEDDQGQAVITVAPASDLAVTKIADQKYYVVGSNATFTITVINSGPDASTGATVQDILPAGLTYVSSSGGTYSDVTGIWSIGVLPVGASTSLTVTASVTAQAIIENIAQVWTADQFDPDSTPGNSVPSEDDQGSVRVVGIVPGIQVIKTVSDDVDGNPELVFSGTDVDFTYAIINTGDTYLSGVAVTDDVLGAIGTYGGIMAPGQIVYFYAVHSNVTASVTNTALVSGNPSDSEGIDLPNVPTVTDTDTAETLVVAPSVSLIKLAGNAPEGEVYHVARGGDVAYSYIVVNNGDTSLYGLSVTDNVLGVVGTFAGPLAPGATNIFYATNYTVMADVTNVAIVTADPNPFAPPRGDDEPDLPLVSATNDAVASVGYLQIAKEDLPDPVHPGAPLSYTVWVANQSPNAVTGIVVTEQYSPEFTFASSVPAPTSGDNVWTIGTLPAGSLMPIVINGVISGSAAAGSTLTNVVAVTSADGGSYTNTELTAVTGDPSAGGTEIVVTKRDSADPVGAGAALTYTIRVENFGPVTASNVLVTETYDQLFTYGSALPAPVAGTSNVWALGDIPANSFMEISVSGTVSASAPSGYILVDHAVGTASNATPSSDDEITLVSMLPPPVVSKTSSLNPVLAGNTLIYTVTVQNVSAVTTVSNVTVVERYDPHFEYVSSVPAPMAGTSNVWYLGDLPPLYVTNIAITGTVLTNTVAVAVLFNTAEVISDAGSRTVHLTNTVYQQATIGGVFWEDDNNNHVFDGILTDVPEHVIGQHVYLYDSNNVLIATVTEDNTSRYAFTNLWPGSYHLEFEPPSNHVFTVPGFGTNELMDSDAGTNGVTAVITLSPGQIDLSWGAGLVENSLIAGYVWVDVNGNGVPDENLGTWGINGATVRLYVNSVAPSNLVDTMVSNQGPGINKGFFQFTKIHFGTYVVMIDQSTVPALYSSKTTAMQYTVVLGYASLFLNADFGFDFPPTAITLKSFTATDDDSGVVLQWETGVELMNLGFNLYRSETLSGALTKLNAALIPGLGSSEGQAYKWQDKTSSRENTYYYWLEDVSWDFEATMHGPAIRSGNDGGIEGSGSIRPARLFWQLPSGQAAAWRLDTNGTVQSVTNLYAGVTAWQISGAGDIDVDGTSDLVWQYADGKAACWFMNDDDTRRAGTNMSSAATPWQVRGAGDIDGDGTADLVWQLPTGQVACWFMNTNGTRKAGTNAFTNTTTWVVRGVGDIDGDGTADLVWQLPTGQVACWFMDTNGTRKAGANLYTNTSTWVVRGVGDIDGDGASDLVWQLPTGQVACWFMNTNGTRKAGANIYTNQTQWIIRGVGK